MINKTLLLCSFGLACGMLATSVAAQCNNGVHKEKLVLNGNVLMRPLAIDLTTCGNDVQIVWEAPEGYEFHKSGIYLKPPPSPPWADFYQSYPGDENTNPSHPPGHHKKYHLRDKNQQQGTYNYTIIIYNQSNGTSISIDPIIINAGSPS